MLRAFLLRSEVRPPQPIFSMLRSNHYDAAFEAWLKQNRIPHVVVDEAKRAQLADQSLKSMDFIVHSASGPNLLVDVKGRKFPSGQGSGNKWENWIESEDLDSLHSWEQIFGSSFRAVFFFAYDVVDPRYRTEFDELFSFRRHEYAFFGIWADEYRLAQRQRSPRWQTVNLPRQIFHELRQPVRAFFPQIAPPSVSPTVNLLESAG